MPEGKKKSGELEVGDNVRRRGRDSILEKYEATGWETEMKIAAACPVLEDRDEIKMEAMGRTEAQDERIMRSLLDFKKRSFCHFMDVTEFLCLLRRKGKIDRK